MADEDPKGTHQAGIAARAAPSPVTVNVHGSGQTAQPPVKAPGGDGGEDWKTRFTNLNQSHAQQKAEWETAKVELEDQLRALGTQFEEVTGNTQTLSSERDQLKGEFDELQLSSLVIEAHNAKLTILAEKHPNLVQFQEFIPHVSSDGAILTEEELTASIEKFAELQGAGREAIVQEFRKGHVPSAPGEAGKDGVLTLEQLAAKIEAQAGLPGSEDGLSKLWRDTVRGT